MSQLKQVVRSALEMRQVSPAIINNVDTLLQRSIVRLQNSDILPPRTLEFTSIDRKQEKRIDDDLIYNFYYLPEDFRKLDEFRPYENYPYKWQSNEHSLYKKIGDTLSDAELKKIQNQFTIINTHHDDDSKYEKILIAFPFPDDDETIQIKYYVNGKNVNYDWIDEGSYEAIIADIEEMVGIRQSGDPETEKRISQAVERQKELKGSNQNNGTQGTLSGSFFGKRSRNINPRRNNINNV